MGSKERQSKAQPPGNSAFGLFVRRMGSRYLTVLLALTWACLSCGATCARVPACCPGAPYAPSASAVLRCLSHAAPPALHEWYSPRPRTAPGRTRVVLWQHRRVGAKRPLRAGARAVPPTLRVPVTPRECAPA